MLELNKMAEEKAKTSSDETGCNDEKVFCFSSLYEKLFALITDAIAIPCIEVTLIKYRYISHGP